MKEMLIGLGIPIIISAACAVLVGLKKRGKTLNLGITLGTMQTTLTRKWLHKLIPAPEKSLLKLEDGIEFSQIDIVDGWKIGIRSDNKKDKEKIKNMKIELKKVNTEKEIKEIREKFVL